MIKIEVSRRDVAWLLRPLQEFPKECQGAMWQAVKRSLSTARKEMTEEISALAYLKRSVIRDAVQPVQMYGKKRAEHDRRYKVADKDKVFGVILPCMTADCINRAGIPEPPAVLRDADHHKLIFCFVQILRHEAGRKVADLVLGRLAAEKYRQSFHRFLLQIQFNFASA